MSREKPARKKPKKGASIPVERAVELAEQLFGFKLAPLPTPEGASPDEPQPDATDSERLPEDDTEIFERLAEMPLPDYDRVREETATALGIRMPTLDDEVAKRRPSAEVVEGYSRQLKKIVDPEPWGEPVVLSALLQDLVDFYDGYLVLPQDGAVVMALWTVNTYVYKNYRYVPFLLFDSPVPECGKTTALALLRMTARRGLPASDISSAVLFRLIDRKEPTLLLDEMHGQLAEHADLRRVVNAASSREGVVWRCEGEDLEPYGFPCYAPIALAGWKNLPPDTLSRTIRIFMRKASIAESRSGFDKATDEIGLAMAQMCMRWAIDSEAAVAALKVEMPPGVINRQADKYRPLLAIAQLAGGKWPELALRLASRPEEGDTDAVAIQLLRHIRELFETRRKERVPNPDEVETEGLLSYLHARDDGPWNEMGRHHDKPLTARGLAELLARFRDANGIPIHSSKNLGTGRQRGYRYADFVDAWGRYAS